MRIATLSPYFPPGRNAGSEVMLRWLADSLVKAGHEVLAVATEQYDRRGQRFTLNNIDICFTDEHSYEAPLREFNPDVIIGQQKHITSVARLKHRLASRPKAVALLHSDTQGVFNRLSSNLDLVVYNTHWLHEKLPTRYAESIVVHPPVWPSEHRTTPGDAITLVNLSVHKGALMFYELTKDFPNQKFLGVTGGYGDQIIPADLPSNVEIIPNTDDMRTDVWSRTRVLIMPSAYESYGLVAVEAIQSGISVIASPTEGLAESLSYAGVFVPSTDVDGWVRALHMVLHNWQHRSELALERAIELDTADEMSLWVHAIEKLHRR